MSETIELIPLMLHTLAVFKCYISIINKPLKTAVQKTGVLLKYTAHHIQFYTVYTMLHFIITAHY